MIEDKLSETTSEAVGDASLSIFIVPLQNNKILLPSNTVAEIIPYEPLQRVQNTPDWFLGFLSWRGIQVPVISFEMLTVEGTSFSLVSVSSASIVIIRVFDEQLSFKYMAVVAQTLPSSAQLERHQIGRMRGELRDTELLQTKLNDGQASVPDLDFLEQSIEQVAFT